MHRFTKSIRFCLFLMTAYAHAQNTFPATGNVGIGTTNPAYTLDVTGTARVTEYGGGTSSAFLASSAAPGYAWYVSGQATDQKVWDVVGVGTTLLFRTVNDTNTGANTWLEVNRGIGFNINGVTFPNGNVGIGTTSPAYPLDVTGKMHSTAGVVYPDGTTQTTAWTGVLCGGDYAESVDVTGARAEYEPGDVMVVDPGSPGNFLRTSEPYSTLVAGIYSTKPGAIGRRSTDASKTKNEIPMAMIGIVPTKVSAENGPIKPGDLLVTSSTPGYAMKGTDRDRMTGAIVGKALSSVQKDTGIIEVLVTLQ